MIRTENVRVTAAVVASALFMQNLDGTVVATALPAMARDMNLSAVHLSATITSYLVALTVFIPASGWVADRFGAKRVFMWAIAIFTLASALCALSTQLGPLIAARIVQGIGGAMMVPVGRLLLFRRARREELLTATTWLTMPALLGPVLGPPLGGFLTDALSWQSVFWINVPVGLVGLALTHWLIPEQDVQRPPAPDLIGMALIGSALTALMVGMETAGRGLLPAHVPTAFIASGVVLLAWTVRHCKRVEHPAVDFSLLRIPTFNVSNVAGSLFRLGAGALPFLLPLTLQIGFGLSATRSGMITLASALGSFAMRPMSGYALNRFSVRSVLVVGSVSFTLTLALCATLSEAWPSAAIFGLLLVAGCSRSLAFATLGALSFADVTPAQLSSATSLQGTLQQLMKAVGVAAAASALQASMLWNGHLHAMRGDFSVAFIVIALLVLVSAPMFYALDPRAGEGIAGKKKPAAPPGQKVGGHVG